jgi:hypothetical protein
MKKTLLRFFFPALFVVLAGLIVSSCSKYPTYTVNTSDLDMVWTEYDESVDFSTYKTYFVPDTLLVDSTMSPEDKAYIQEYYENILVEINANMTALNYVKVDSSANPDIGLVISIVTQTNYVFSYSYWYYYPPYWGYPGYGYSYPWATYMGSYEEGALIFDMADLKNINHQGQNISGIWSALCGGILTGSTSTTISKRLIDGIDQAFTQSPYLGTE